MVGLLISSYRLLGTVERLLIQFSYSYLSCLSTYGLLDSRGSCTQPYRILIMLCWLVMLVTVVSQFLVPYAHCTLQSLT